MGIFQDIERLSTMSILRSIPALIATLLLSQVVASCSKGVEESSAYQAACQGPPLRTIELRNKAMEDGYDINRQYDCIDKASFVAANGQKAVWEAANTPEAIAQRKAEREKIVAEEKARRTTSVPRQEVTSPQESLALSHVDVNTATESELANVVSVGPVVAAQILEERKKGRFSNWADLVNRVIGLGSAQNAVFASVSGLNVDGQTLPGAPPDPVMAAKIYARYQENKRP
jgi:DNA uptake protein ComE-like DNA-binding protein